MLLDWPTVVIQMINFMALVLLLRVVLYDRVLEAMQARKRRVAARLEEAETREARAREAEKELREKQHELAEEREEILAEARREALERKEALLDEAQQEVKARREAGTRNIEAEAGRLIEELRIRLGAQLHVLARRALADLADEDLERRMLGLLLGQLEDFFTRHPAEVEALAGGHGAIRVRSAFELQEEAAGELEATLREHLGRDLKVHYEADPEMICGIELRAGGRALGWSIDGYLDGLAGELQELVGQDSVPPPRPEAREEAAEA